MSKKLRILVVDDREANLNVAKVMFRQHDLTLARTYVEASNALLQEVQGVPSFDVVLTDVMLPRGRNFQMSKKGQALVDQQGPMPYGLAIALQAIRWDVKRIGILTAGNHHDDPFVDAIEHLDDFTVGDVRIIALTGFGTLVDSSTYQKWEIPGLDLDAMEAALKDGSVLDVKNWAGLLGELDA